MNKAIDMLPRTEAGFQAYIRSKFKEEEKDFAIQQLYSRYAYLIGKIEAPDITAAELNLLRECARITWFQRDEEPIDLLQRILMTMSMGICSDYYCDQALKAEEGKPYDEGDPPEAEKYNDLYDKISKWSPLQGLKVIEAMERLDAEHTHIIDLTAEAMVVLLHSHRDQENERIRPTSIPAYLMIHPDHAVF